jgi:predicted nuclease of predicted toxin-antitoxin system
VKVYLDEDLSPTVVVILRDAGIDAVGALDVGNLQLDDRAQLAWATRHGRTIITANVRDFVRLAHEAVATNTPHAGILLIPSSFAGHEFRAIADAIRRVVKDYPRGLSDAVVYVLRK